MPCEIPEEFGRTEAARLLQSLHFVVSSYVLLGCAVICEALWAAMLRMSNGLSVSWTSGVTALAYVGSLACLSLACRGLAVSLAYPIWTGLGGALAVLIGVLWFKEPIGAMKVLGVALVLTGVMVLHGFGSPSSEQADPLPRLHSSGPKGRSGV